MTQSRNTTVDYTIKGTSYIGSPTYGEIMVGNRAFEFYNDRNIKDYIRIPRDEVGTIITSVLPRDRKISRLAIMTKSSGTFSLSFRDNRTLLRTVANYIDGKRMVRSLSSSDVVKRSIERTVHRKKEDPASC